MGYGEGVVQDRYQDLDSVSVNFLRITHESDDRVARRDLGKNWLAVVASLHFLHILFDEALLFPFFFFRL